MPIQSQVYLFRASLDARIAGADYDEHNILGVEQDLAILQEFLIPGVLWGYLECIHFPEITNSRSS